MNVNRTTIVAALLAAGIATTAFAQTTSPGTTTTKPAPGATTPAPPAPGSTGMDKGAGTGAAASAPSGTAKGTASKVSGSDRRFVENAMQGGMAEVEISKLAMDKAQNAQVKAFAKRLVDDHTKANAELTSLASAKGITGPTAVDASHKRKLERMSKRSGPDFDRDYMGDMVDDHQKTVRDFRSASKSAKDADVKAFAAKALPTLEQHLAEAKSIDASIKGKKPATTKS